MQKKLKAISLAWCRLHVYIISLGSVHLYTNGFIKKQLSLDHNKKVYYKKKKKIWITSDVEAILQTLGRSVSWNLSLVAMTVSVMSTFTR